MKKLVEITRINVRANVTCRMDRSFQSAIRDWRRKRMSRGDRAICDVGTCQTGLSIPSGDMPYNPPETRMEPVMIRLRAPILSIAGIWTNAKLTSTPSDNRIEPYQDGASLNMVSIQISKRMISPIRYVVHRAPIGAESVNAKVS